MIPKTKLMLLSKSATHREVTYRVTCDTPQCGVRVDLEASPDTDVPLPEGWACLLATVCGVSYHRILCHRCAERAGAAMEYALEVQTSQRIFAQRLFYEWYAEEPTRLRSYVGVDRADGDITVLFDGCKLVTAESAQLSTGSDSQLFLEVVWTPKDNVLGKATEARSVVVRRGDTEYLFNVKAAVALPFNTLEAGVVHTEGVVFEVEFVRKRQELDHHRVEAANTYAVPFDQVTPEMRRTQKTVDFATTYSKHVGLPPAADLDAVLGLAAGPTKSSYPRKKGRSPSSDE